MLYRSIAHNQVELNHHLIEQFNSETKFGKHMNQYIESLNIALDSIKKNKDKNKIDILFDSQNYLTKTNDVEFQLISFLIIKQKGVWSSKWKKY